MTEPEDLEEDLFADLYDADNTATHTAPSAEPAEAPEHAVTATPAEPTPSSAVHAAESTVPYPSTENHQISSGEGYQNGGGAQDAASGMHAVGSAVESEPQGTGIKEDG